MCFKKNAFYFYQKKKAGTVKSGNLTGHGNKFSAQFNDLKEVRMPQSSEEILILLKITELYRSCEISNNLLTQTKLLRHYNLKLMAKKNQWTNEKANTKIKSLPENFTKVRGKVKKDNWF